MAKLSEQNCDLMNGDLNRSVDRNKSEKNQQNYEMKSLIKSNNNNNNCNNSPQKSHKDLGSPESQQIDERKKL